MNSTQSAAISRIGSPAGVRFPMFHIGFIADADDDVGPLFDWYNNGEVEINEYARVSQASVR